MSSQRDCTTSTTTSDAPFSSQASTLTPSQGTVLSLNQRGKRPVTNVDTGSNATATTDQPFPESRCATSQANPTHSVIFVKGIQRTEIVLKQGTEKFTVEWDHKHKNCIFKETTVSRREKKHKDEEVHHQVRERIVDGWLSRLPGGVRYEGEKGTIVTGKWEKGEWTFTEN